MILRLIGLSIGLGVYRLIAAIARGDRDDAEINGMVLVILVMLALLAAALRAP